MVVITIIQPRCNIVKVLEPPEAGCTGYALMRKVGLNPADGYIIVAKHGGEILAGTTHHAHFPRELLMMTHPGIRVYIPTVSGLNGEEEPPKYICSERIVNVPSTRGIYFDDGKEPEIQGQLYYINTLAYTASPALLTTPFTTLSYFPDEMYLSVDGVLIGKMSDIITPVHVAALAGATIVILTLKKRPAPKVQLLSAPGETRIVYDSGPNERFFELVCRTSGVPILANAMGDRFAGTG